MHKFLLISWVCLFFFCGSKAYGQVTDSVVTSGDDPIVEVREDIDTSLYFHTHIVPEDSITAWRNSKSFAYIKYIDSLLKSQETVMSSGSSSKVKSKDSPSPIQSVPENNSSSSDSSFLSSPILSVFLWILAGAFILFILYKLFLTEGIFKKKIRSVNEQAAPEVTEEVVTSESDFDRLVRLALTAGNYRLAVRYQYLKTLHHLAGRNYVEMAVDKTNYQYVQEIQNHQLRNDFASLTLNYEYVWYGEFQIEQFIYQKLETAFSAFNQKV